MCVAISRLISTACSRFSRSIDVDVISECQQLVRWVSAKANEPANKQSAQHFDQHHGTRDSLHGSDEDVGNVLQAELLLDIVEEVVEVALRLAINQCRQCTLIFVRVEAVLLEEWQHLQAGSSSFQRLLLIRSQCHADCRAGFGLFSHMHQLVGHMVEKVG